MSISMHHLRHKKQEKNPLPPSLGVRGDILLGTLKTIPRKISLTANAGFQFLLGTLKTYSKFCLLFPLSSFNSF